MAHWLCSRCFTVNINVHKKCSNVSCQLHASATGVQVPRKERSKRPLPETVKEAALPTVVLTKPSTKLPKSGVADATPEPTKHTPNPTNPTNPSVDSAKPPSKPRRLSYVASPKLKIASVRKVVKIASAPKALKIASAPKALTTSAPALGAAFGSVVGSAVGSAESGVEPEFDRDITDWFVDFLNDTADNSGVDNSGVDNSGVEPLAKK
tara:strand:+ start:1087 stop:1713 length:627 start_codon:yes stop_codon:yes gene_type:complete